MVNYTLLRHQEFLHDTTLQMGRSNFSLLTLLTIYVFRILSNHGQYLTAHITLPSVLMTDLPRY